MPIIPRATVDSAKSYSAGATVFGLRRKRSPTHFAPRLMPCSMSSNKVKTGGITSSDKKVEVIKPPITATAIGDRKLGSAVPVPMAMGNMPAAIAMVVMMIGLARLWQASSSASIRDIL